MIGCLEERRTRPTGAEKHSQALLRLPAWCKKRNLANKEDYDGEYCDSTICNSNLKQFISVVNYTNRQTNVPWCCHPRLVDDPNV
jgi:hypothetical protein